MFDHYNFTIFFQINNVMRLTTIPLQENPLKVVEIAKNHLFKAIPRKFAIFAKNEFMWLSECQRKANFSIAHVSDVIIVTFYYVWDHMCTIGMMVHHFPESSFVFHIRRKMLWKSTGIAKKPMKLRTRRTGNTQNCCIKPHKIGLQTLLISIGIKIG